MKRIIILCLAFLLCAQPVFADTMQNKAVFSLTALGVVTGDENGELHLDENVTRAEFAQMSVRLLGYGEAAAAQTNLFSDVSDDFYAAGAISLLAELGYASGDENGLFHPTQTILVQDCYKIAVSILSYDVLAEKTGYPAGYVSMAHKVGLTEAVSQKPNELATRDTAMMILYNALYIAPLEWNMSTAESAWTKGEKTLEEQLCEQLELTHLRGVITANYDSWLLAPVGHIKEGQIEIDGQLYQMGATQATAYLGQSVEAYYQTDKGGVRTLMNLAPLEVNEEHRLLAEDVFSIDNGVFSYLTPEGKTQKLIPDDEVIFVYNGRMLTDNIEDKSLRIQNGQYKLIDNDGDGRYEYCFIYVYTSSVVERVNLNGSVYVKNDAPVNGKNHIIFDDDSERICRMYDAEENLLAPEAIEPGMTVSVYQSLDGGYTKLVFSDKTVTGTLETISSDSVTIDGTTYNSYYNLSLTDVRPGDGVTAYLNEFDELVYIKAGEETSLRYGYIRSFKQNGISNCRVQIIESGKVKNKVEIDENSDDETEIPVLLCENAAVLDLTLNDTVQYNGERIRAEALAALGTQPVPIRFKTRDNAVTSIEELPVEYGSTLVKLQYNAKDQTFGGISGITPFGINADTKVICLPTDTAANEEDMLTQIKIDNRDASVKYLASGYLMDENTKCVKLLFVITDMKADTVLNLTASSDIALVKKQVTALDEEGNEVLVTTMLCDGEEIEFISDNLTAANGDAARLSTGDFILLATNNSDELVNAKIISALSKKLEHKQNMGGQINGSITGVVTEIERLAINNELNKRVHVLTINAGGLNYRVELSARNIPNIYIYNQSKGSAQVGSLDDIVHGDVICVAMPMGEASDCVLVRGCRK